jgi:hypothetical protein
MQDGSAEAGMAARLQLWRGSCAARACRQAAATPAARSFAPRQPPICTCAPATQHACRHHMCDATLLSDNHMLHGLAVHGYPDRWPPHIMCQWANAGGSLAGGFGVVQGSAAGSSGSAQPHSIRAHRPQAWRQQQVGTGLHRQEHGCATCAWDKYPAQSLMSRPSAHTYCRWVVMRRRLAAARRSRPPHQHFRMACATRRYALAYEHAGLQYIVSFNFRLPCPWQWLLALG